MRPIDADALIDEIKKDTEKAIKQDDRVGSFWLGYIAGLVIKQPTIQPQSTVGQINDNARSTAQSTDLIDRQAAIDAIEKMNIPEDMCVFEILSHIEVEIATLPTIQPVATDTNVGDTISRQAAIDVIEAGRLTKLIDAESAVNGLKNLPPAQPEPTGINAKEAVYNLAEKIGIHQLFALTVELRGEPIQPEPHEGHWIRRDCGLDVECKCSECGYRDFVEPRDEYWFNRNYCPNCGAKMTISTK